jgi:two-component system response regulator RegX3
MRVLDCLVIDDEVSIAETICEYFALFGLQCEYATDYEAGLRAATDKLPSLSLLDVNLGGQSGFMLCKTLRESSDVPILFISARNADDDILAALGVGGDDYIAKPFSMAVLLAKAKAMLKRNAIAQKPVPGGAAQAGEAAGVSGAAWAGEAAGVSGAASPASVGDVARFGDVEVDRGSGRVFRGGEPVRMRPLEWKLLLYLIDNQGRRVTKDELLEKVWGDTFIGDGTLSVHVRHLREKLEGDPKYPRYIKTMWGSGYMFEAQG